MTSRSCATDGPLEERSTTGGCVGESDDGRMAFDFLTEEEEERRDDVQDLFAEAQALFATSRSQGASLGSRRSETRPYGQSRTLQLLAGSAFSDERVRSSVPASQEGRGVVEGLHVP